MAVRPVLRIGDRRLLERALPVEDFSDPALKELVADMIETMRERDGVGLAAPQIGISLRLVVFEVAKNPRYPEAEAVPLTVLLNPELEAMSEDIEEGWEGCLSIPGMRGLVPRYQSIRYRGFDENGRFVTRDASGFHARVVQHECDHLDGILYPMRVRDLRNFGFNEELFPEKPCPAE